MPATALAAAPSRRRRLRSVPEPIDQWPEVPEAYRRCLAFNRHTFGEPISAGILRGHVLEWHRCDECSTDRLTVTSPSGQVERSYSHPEHYSRPTWLTPTVASAWRADRAASDARSRANGAPTLDIEAARSVFGRLIERLER